MATILLSAAGAALGAGFGGTIVGLSGAVIGRAVGATIGRAIDQRLMGAGSEAVEVGRIDRFRLMGASEGDATTQMWGRTRLAGQVIWATRFLESATTSGGGKGAPRPKTTQYSYSVSLAIALCEGEISRIGRIWADGVEIAPESVNLRVYAGREDQLPDPKIAAVEGDDHAPAYRGIAYVVMEDLALSAYGNRVPQFTFEVVRRAQGGQSDTITDLPRAVKAVAMIPGTGEYALATQGVHYNKGLGVNQSANVHTVSGKADFSVSLEQLREELPGCGSISLVVSWFGNDLRCGQCEVKPKVEQNASDGVGMAWRAGGIGRAAAGVVPLFEGRPVYGGTPTDQSVIQAIAAIRAGGQEVMFYPFILMEQLPGNGLADPYSDVSDQPSLPWRGRITTAKAPGQPGSTDRTATAEAEVAAFFGTAQPVQFSVAGGQVVYSGSAAWGYRRFVLHYAKLCALAGGVDAFCIGSEMRGLTQIRGAGDSFPAVDALRQLAADVRTILGPNTKISYAADWSEYFGYHTDGNVYFHLDPLWADSNIDFVGIDNYMPISDWRDGEDHADAGWGAVYNLDYLKANIAGGEGFDWFYDGAENETAQLRQPIIDGAYDEPWVFRYKDLKSWWSNLHHDRIDGIKLGTETAWVPMSKPFRFTEYGCAAIDKGTNQPNKFLDAKSDESGLPKYSNGRRDDLIQMQYLRAMAEFWADGDNNPASHLYAGQMLDTAYGHAWAWDVRPFPAFPNMADTWSDGASYARGHWLNGRMTAQPLGSVVAEICIDAGVADVDVSRLYGLVRGFVITDTSTARAALQPLMTAFGFDAVERGGLLGFGMRNGRIVQALLPEHLAMVDEIENGLEVVRTPDAEIAGRVRIGYVDADGNYDLRVAEAIFPDEASRTIAQSDLPIVMTASEGRAVVERWLAEARVARDTARFALPRSDLQLGAGDVVTLAGRRYRIDRVEQTDAQIADVVCVEAGVYEPSDTEGSAARAQVFAAPVPVYPVFLDLPLLTGAEEPHAPHIAVTASPWPGAVGVWSSAQQDGFDLSLIVAAPSIVGVTESELPAAQPGVWDRGQPLRVKVYGGALSSASEDAVLNGTNVMAIGDGSSGLWEVFQFVQAQLISEGVFDVALRLRGQAGTDGVMPSVWPTGSQVVLLNTAVQQLELPLSARGLARNYRIGAVSRGYDDTSVVVRSEAFDGIGLRPYRVSHLMAMVDVSGTVSIRWIRRTRIDGDSWQSADVPVGETTEAYLVRVVVGSTIIREVSVSSASWTYSSALRASDGVVGPFAIEVGQVSERFGVGPMRRADVTI